MADVDTLREALHRLEGGPYPAYKDIAGRYTFPGFTLSVDHVQGDPFAEPSRVSVHLPLEQAAIPEDLLATPSRALGVCNHLARGFAALAAKRSRHLGTGKGGLLTMDGPGQEVLASTAVQLRDDHLEARFQVGLPARGRRAMGRAAAELLCEVVPELVTRTLCHQQLDVLALRAAAEANEDAETLRAALAERDLVAFVADDAVLPRRSGVDPRPLPGRPVRFRSPENLRVEIDLPNAGRVTGLGVPRGVTLIVGGGFHGKSTLLQALELGVYNHCPGDGRERVVTDPTAVKIRAEDGRAVAGVDITPFISGLPGGADTERFSTQDASGSTSQATNILEALEVGARVLLMDEDTSATNFMIRDQRMQELIAEEQEPITPFVDRVQLLWREYGVSTVLVMGGSGDYFDVADTVIAMHEYRPRDVTAEARAVAGRHPGERRREGGKRFGAVRARCPDGDSLDPRKGRRAEHVRSRGLRTVLFGGEEIDLSAVEQVVHPGQLRSVGAALLRLRELADGRTPLAELLDQIETQLAQQGLDLLSPWKVGNLSGFRRFELAAALNRLRTLRVAGG